MGLFCCSCFKAKRRAASKAHVFMVSYQSYELLYVPDAAVGQTKDHEGGTSERNRKRSLFFLSTAFAVLGLVPNLFPTYAVPVHLPPPLLRSLRCRYQCWEPSIPTSGSKTNTTGAANARVSGPMAGDPAEKMPTFAVLRHATLKSANSIIANPVVRVARGFSALWTDKIESLLSKLLKNVWKIGWLIAIWILDDFKSYLLATKIKISTIQSGNFVIIIHSNPRPVR